METDAGLDQRATGLTVLLNAAKDWGLWTRDLRSPRVAVLAPWTFCCYHEFEIRAQGLEIPMLVQYRS